MIWFEPGRIPPGNWPMISVVYAGLSMLEESLPESVDMTDGNGNLLISGCMEVYYFAVARRVMDCSVGAIAAWNAGALVGSISCARSLLEVLSTFHEFQERVRDSIKGRDWQMVAELVDAYGLSEGRIQNNGENRQAPCNVSRAVKNFIRTIHNGDEKFWNQICNLVHPNGVALIKYGGDLDSDNYQERDDEKTRIELFSALYNCLISCNWFVAVGGEFENLLEEILNGGQADQDQSTVNT